MATDDDILNELPPEPDAEPTAAELAQATAFAALVEQSLAGAAPPPAMAADDRSLLELATVIRAAHGRMELPAATGHSLVEAALRQAIGAPSPVGSSIAAVVGVTSIASARAKRTWLPWSVAGASTAIAAAAVAMLWLRGPERSADTLVQHAPPAAWTSRPADPLIGQIPRERAAAADTRIDRIFEDRLEGYRERRMTPPRREVP